MFASVPDVTQAGSAPAAGNLQRMSDPVGTGTPTLQTGEQQLARQSFMTSVFAWMFVGLGLTAGIAAYVAASNDMLAWFEDHSLVFFGLLIAEIGMVIGISAGINRMSYQVAVFLFAAYAALNGFTLSIILEVYTTASIVSAFAVAAGMFGGMAAYGYATKRDLSGLRSILFMGLIGVIIGLFVNIIWANSVLYWFVTFAGVLVFCGLTAYDMQKLKQIGSSGMDEETAQKTSILGALSLYLDFINLFLFLLRIFGSAR
jgi:FtsH-binding integral membrane protein